MGLRFMGDDTPKAQAPRIEGAELSAVIDSGDSAKLDAYFNERASDPAIAAAEEGQKYMQALVDDMVVITRKRRDGQPVAEDMFKIGAKIRHVIETLTPQQIASILGSGVVAAAMLELIIEERRNGDV